jgi:hypothetical protein
MKYSNRSNLDLPLAVWLAADDGYDLRNTPKVVSATTLMKSTKSVVLAENLKQENLQSVVDIQDLVPSRMGTALHTAVETSWDHYKTGMENLGYPQAVIDAVKFNPDPAELDEDDYPIWMEIRSEKKVGDWTVSGKFDIVENYQVADIKSTKVYNWVHGSNDQKYALQGSIYRWLNPNLITDDFMKVHFILTDWSELKASTDKAYPHSRLMTRTIPLMDTAQTGAYIHSRIGLLNEFWGKPENEIPPCTPDEVWQRPEKFAYYKNPTNKRATRVFDTMSMAIHRKFQDGNTGRIEVRKGEVKFCNYCPAAQFCNQAAEYRELGLLTI